MYSLPQFNLTSAIWRLRGAHTDRKWTGKGDDILYTGKLKDKRKLSDARNEIINKWFWLLVIVCTITCESVLWRHDERKSRRRERERERDWAQSFGIFILQTVLNSALLPSQPKREISGFRLCRLRAGPCLLTHHLRVDEEGWCPTGRGPLISEGLPPPGWCPAVCRQRWLWEMSRKKRRLGTWPWSERTLSPCAGQVSANDRRVKVRIYCFRQPNASEPNFDTHAYVIMNTRACVVG